MAISKYNKTKDVAIHDRGNNRDLEHRLILEEHSTTVGPIPSPEEFAKYKQVSEDMPNRILSQFEQDSASVRDLSHKALGADIEFDKRSQYMAYSVIAIGLLGTIFLAYNDKDVAAVCTGLSTLILVFKDVFSRKT